jgi:hypothetical protein
VPLNFDRYQSKPVAERKTVIGYRGRPLPYHYGDLGREKVIIAQRMKEICDERGIPTDIEWSHEKRIYGDAWYEFVAGSKATLGTESGSNVFDDYGEIKENIEHALTEDPSLSYEVIHAEYIGDREGQIRMNQVSPRIFEAIALRTALVLFEGDYSGVVQPDIHFIPLKRDFSNVEDVLGKLQDDQYLTDLTDRAYRDVIASKKYNYRQFIRGVDDFLAGQVTGSTGEGLVFGLVGASHLGQQGLEITAYKVNEKGGSVRNSLFSISPLNPQQASIEVVQPFYIIKFRDVWNLSILWLIHICDVIKTRTSNRMQKHPDIYESVYPYYKSIREFLKRTKE